MIRYTIEYLDCPAHWGTVLSTWHAKSLQATTEFQQFVEYIIGRPCRVVEDWRF